MHPRCVRLQARPDLLYVHDPPNEHCNPQNTYRLRLQIRLLQLLETEAEVYLPTPKPPGNIYSLKLQHLLTLFRMFRFVTTMGNERLISFYLLTIRKLSSYNEINFLSHFELNMKCDYIFIKDSMFKKVIPSDDISIRDIIMYANIFFALICDFIYYCKIKYFI